MPVTVSGVIVDGKAVDEYQMEEEEEMVGDDTYLRNILREN